MRPTYDAIVLGTGGVGSAALWHLARRGLRVLGIDQFAAGHDRGSSHGQSRAIRQAYFEHPDYVPLLREAYRLWDELQAHTGQMLFDRVGLLEVGPPDGIVVPGVLQSARTHNLDVEQLTIDEAGDRFPMFRFPEDALCVFERNAGYLLVEPCVLAHLEAAEKCGATLLSGERVVGWQATADGVTVRTAHAAYDAARLVITAGPWAGQLLGDLGLPLQVLRKHLHWYRTPTPAYARHSGCPVYFFELGRDFFYGFPQLDERGVKVAEHGGGELIRDPLIAPRHVDPVDRRRIEAFLTRCMPHVALEAKHHEVCFYTMTPDYHFVVDRHPQFPQVAFAAGLSGHGFKFTTVLGRVLADLVIDGNTPLAMNFLRLREFA